jgi:phage gp29-like protein
VNRRALPLVAVAFLVGCNGGTIDRQDLSKNAGTLDSISCEAMLLAQGVAQDRTTATFTREQSAVLRVQTSNEADAFARRTAAVGLEQRARALSKRAARLAELLQRLHDHPAERALGAELQRAFKAAGKCQ